MTCSRDTRGYGLKEYDMPLHVGGVRNQHQKHRQLRREVVMGI